MAGCRRALLKAMLTPKVRAPRAPTPYIIFGKAHRENAGDRKVSLSEIATAWKLLGDAEKQPYIDQAEVAKQTLLKDAPAEDSATAPALTGEIKLKSDAAFDALVKKVSAEVVADFFQDLVTRVDEKETIKLPKIGTLELDATPSKSGKGAPKIVITLKPSKSLVGQE